MASERMFSNDVRSTADTEDVELCLVQAHITQSQSGKQARQEDQDRYEDDERHSLAAMNTLRETMLIRIVVQVFMN
jgi:hypothetical protein